MSPLVDYSKVDPQELVELGAVDSLLFSKAFLPKTFRQEFSSFHPRMWRVLEKRGKPYRMLQVFRGGSKTTICRAFTAKRVAYALSNTILYLGKSEAKALASTRWLRRQVDHNRLFAETFSLRRGSKWQDHEFEIIHGVDERSIWVVGMGIEGSVRGINIDDYRPDTIVLDDVVDRQNAATKEQRQVMNELIYGAIANSLISRAENPNAVMVGLQTPLDREDYSVLAENDPEWEFFRFSCWTPETEDLPTDQQVSAWEEYFPTLELREKKRAYMHRNQLSIWNREFECRITSKETSAFKSEWLQQWDLLPEVLTHILVIDPVPPPTPLQVKKGLHGKDYESLAVVGVGKGKMFIREISVSRGHEPTWTATEFFRLCRKYRISRVLVEAVAYQRTLAWLLRQAMQTRREYYLVEEYDDRRSKFDRIVDSLSNVGSNGVLFIPPDNDPCGRLNSEGMEQFYSQFLSYPEVSHDDALESVAVGCAALAGRLEYIGESEEAQSPEEIELHSKYIGVIGESLCP